MSVHVSIHNHVRARVHTYSCQSTWPSITTRVAPYIWCIHKYMCRTTRISTFRVHVYPRLSTCPHVFMYPSMYECVNVSMCECASAVTVHTYPSMHQCVNVCQMSASYTSATHTATCMEGRTAHAHSLTLAPHAHSLTFQLLHNVSPRAPNTE